MRVQLVAKGGRCFSSFDRVRPFVLRHTSKGFKGKPAHIYLVVTLLLRAWSDLDVPCLAGAQLDPGALRSARHFRLLRPVLALVRRFIGFIDVIRCALLLCYILRRALGKRCQRVSLWSNDFLVDGLWQLFFALCLRDLLPLWL